MLCFKKLLTQNFDVLKYGLLINSKLLETEDKTNITSVINESVKYKQSGNKITNKITKVSKSLETVTSENDKEYLKKLICLQKKRQKIIYHLRLK